MEYVLAIILVLGFGYFIYTKVTKKDKPSVGVSGSPPKNTIPKHNQE